jgi:Sensors of blue-light using FAD
VLEGEESVVSPLYAKIAKDPRHGRCMVVKRSTVAQRSFADWSMGFVEVSAAAARGLEGFNTFLQQGFVDLGKTARAETIKKVFDGFRLGQWRQHVI